MKNMSFVSVKHQVVHVAFLLFLGFCTAFLANIRYSQALEIAVAYPVVTLDARYATDAASSRILRLVAPALLKRDENFAVRPQIAESFTHKNHKIFLLRLKKASFHNGDELTSQDVKNLYENIMQKSTASPLRGYLKNVVKISTPNKQEIIFELSEASPWFWNALTEIPIVKLTVEELKNAEVKIAVDASDKNKEFLNGLGSYKITSFNNQGVVSISLRDSLGFSSGAVIEKVAIENGSDTSGKVASEILQKVTFQVIKDPTVRLLKLLKGEVDVVHNDLPEELYNYGLKKGLLGSDTESASYTYLGLNLESGVTANREVRKAIAYGINRKKISKALLGGRTTKAGSLLLESHPDYYDGDNISYNPQRARELLAEAGYGAVDSGVGVKKQLRLRLATTNNPFIRRLAQIIQQDLAKIGVEVKITSSEWGSFYSNVKKGNFESYILTWVGEFQSDIYESVFHSKMMPPSGVNRGRFSNQLMDSFVEVLMTELNDKERSELAIEVQKIQEQEMIYIPLWRRSHVALYRKGLSEELGFEYKVPRNGGYKLIQ